MPSIATQVWILSIAFTLLTIFICYQSVVLGKLMHSNYGYVEALAWLVLIFYRFYGMWTLSEQLGKAQAAGLIGARLTLSQWFAISGSLLFVIIMILSKHMKRKAIKDSWGI